MKQSPNGDFMYFLSEEDFNLIQQNILVSITSLTLDYEHELKSIKKKIDETENFYKSAKSICNEKDLEVATNIYSTSLSFLQKEIDKAKNTFIQKKNNLLNILNIILYSSNERG